MQGCAATPKLMYVSATPPAFNELPSREGRRPIGRRALRQFSEWRLMGTDLGGLVFGP